MLRVWQVLCSLCLLLKLSQCDQPTNSSTFLSASSSSNSSTNSSTNPQILDVAIRTQRDVSRPIPIDQLTVAGLSLNSLFEVGGYTQESLGNLSSLLYNGTQAIMVDLYWNEFTSVWQLCPAPFPQNMTYNMNSNVNVTWENRTYSCEYGFTTDNVMDALASYIQSTNTDFQANFMHLLYNLKSIHYEKSNRTTELENIYLPRSKTVVVGNSSLIDTVAPISSYLFTPDVLNSFRARGSANYSSYQNFYSRSNFTMPSLETILLSEYKRLLVNIVSDDTVQSRRSYEISDQDRRILFFEDTLPIDAMNTTTADNYCNQVFSYRNTVEDFDNQTLSTHFRYAIDNDNEPFTTQSLRRYVRCGLSPIFNSTSYQVPATNQSISQNKEIVKDYIPQLFWSWAPGQPLVAENSTANRSSSGNVAYKCVYMTPDGWEIGNCYTEHQIACKNLTAPNDWYIPIHERRTYFDVDRNDCPPGFNFSLPRSSIEMLALHNAIQQQGATFPVWIDLNDITVETCFVSGGPYAECPYQRTVTTTKFVKMIAPSSIVALVILILIFLEKTLRKDHLQANRKKYWKKKISEHYSKHEYEGVPS